MSFIVDAFLQKTIFNINVITNNLNQKLLTHFKIIADEERQSGEKEIPSKRRKRGIEFVKKLKLGMGYQEIASSQESQSTPNNIKLLSSESALSKCKKVNLEEYQDYLKDIDERINQLSLRQKQSDELNSVDGQCSERGDSANHSQKSIMAIPEYKDQQLSYQSKPKSILKQLTSYPLEGEVNPSITKSKKKARLISELEISVNKDDDNYNYSIDKFNSKKIKLNEELTIHNNSNGNEEKMFDLQRIKEVMSKIQNQSRLHQQNYTVDYNNQGKTDPNIELQGNFQPFHNMTQIELSKDNVQDESPYFQGQDEQENLVTQQLQQVNQFSEDQKYSFSVQPYESLDNPLAYSCNSNKENLTPFEKSSKSVIQDQLTALKNRENLHKIQNDINNLKLNESDPDRAIIQASNKLIQQYQGTQQQRAPLGEIIIDNINHYDQDYSEQTDYASVYNEFIRDCNSQYVLSDKSSERISSDGEFNDACRIAEFDEDDPIINVIEKQKAQLESCNQYDMLGFGRRSPKLTVSHFVHRIEKDQSKPGSDLGNYFKSKPKSVKYRGMKYFKKIGYTDQRYKNIPRWCTDIELLNKVVLFQKSQAVSADDVFGKFDPRTLKFNLRELFGDPVRNFRKEKKYDRRGSSANWNDYHEFVTPIGQNEGKQFNLNLEDQKSNAHISSFSPFGRKMQHQKFMNRSDDNNTTGFSAGMNYLGSQSTQLNHSYQGSQHQMGKGDDASLHIIHQANLWQNKSIKGDLMMGGSFHKIDEESDGNEADM
ncbi:UNKNOWN [Stylonychia lemnae]|uniref:Uncharacterized protein n=1 Tax=Stylonychia lemnae TaxID=5949 RepID=A0A078AXL0_STYLE|nr:UNKNOWN [Stylonychia lemnae]|eukprot:CDW85977.1 UNKNOWN [Stylonychia lemnae]